MYMMYSYVRNYPQQKFPHLCVTMKYESTFVRNQKYSVPSADEGSVTSDARLWKLPLCDNATNLVAYWTSDQALCDNTLTDSCSLQEKGKCCQFEH